MPRFDFYRIRSSWRRVPWRDRLALFVVVLSLLVRVARLTAPLAGFLHFMAWLALAWLVFRLFAVYRDKFLWSLRNRLVVAYVFIAVVPMILILAIGGLAAYIGYTQLAAYTIYRDIQDKMEKVADTAELMLTYPAAQAPGRAAAEEAEPASSVVDTLASDLPGLRLEYGVGGELLDSAAAAKGSSRYVGLVQAGGQTFLRAVAARGAGVRRRIVSASVPVTPELMDLMVPDLGALRLIITRPARPGDLPERVRAIGDQSVFSITLDGPESLPAAAHFLDLRVDGLSKLDVIWMDAGHVTRGDVYASLSTRPSLLNRRLFNAPGEIGGIWVSLLYVVGIVFLLLEVAALITGVVLTRTITRAIHELYQATEYVQQGDFSYRVRAQQRDQLGALGESFNTMTSSVASLIQEQRQRQKLENELAIAQQVQNQLFPQSLPQLEGLRLAALCRAASVVSGDYYDFIPLSRNRLGIAIADISGKGISAALLMASLQAALRSQVLLDGGLADNTSELVSRLNRHLFLNTSSERYATFFYAAYDGSTRTLHYTNAGHLPALLLVGQQMQRLDAGGMVVGLFDGCAYQQGRVSVEPGSLFVAYSDGLIEPENVYGEEFGIDRLAEEVVRNRALAPRELAERLVRAAEEWAGTAEQADDMTVIVARIE
jgi:sigma-B regulation protein RsbU (phosphoserine phosphatase)